MRRADAGPAVEVVLDEASPDAEERPGPRRPAWRRRRRALAGTCALLAVAWGTSGAGQAADRRDADALQRYAAVPGVVASLRHAPAERWTLPSPRAWAVGEHVVTPEAGVGVVARDVLSGRRVWSVPVRDDAVIGAISCPHESGSASAGRAVVLCFVPRPSEEPLVRAVWGVQVLDQQSGALVRELVFPGFVVGSGMLDGDLVVAQRLGGGLTVSRHDVVRGTAVWSTELPDLYATGRLTVQADGDRVTVTGSVAAVLDARDGGEVGRWLPERGSDADAVRVVGRAGEGFGVWASASSGRWYGSDGRPGPLLPGAPADPTVTDAGTPDVVLLSSPDGRRLQAVDVTTGTPRWDHPTPDAVLLRLDGQVVVVRGRTLEALDAADGRTRWTARLDAGDEPASGRTLTDGLRLLVRGWDADGRSRLTAYDLRSGERQWRTGLPGAHRSVDVLGDRLVSLDRYAPEGGPVRLLR